MLRWEDVVKDPSERKVFEALADSHWDFRTVEGIAKATGLTPDFVQSTLERYSDLVRRSLARDEHGRALFTLASRPFVPQELMALFRSLVTKSSQ